MPAESKLNAPAYSGVIKVDKFRADSRAFVEFDERYAIGHGAFKPTWGCLNYSVRDYSAAASETKRPQGFRAAARADKSGGEVFFTTSRAFDANEIITVFF